MFPKLVHHRFRPIQFYVNLVSSSSFPDSADGVYQMVGRFKMSCLLLYLFRCACSFFLYAVWDHWLRMSSGMMGMKKIIQHKQQVRLNLNGLNVFTPFGLHFMPSPLVQAQHDAITCHEDGWSHVGYSLMEFLSPCAASLIAFRYFLGISSVTLCIACIWVTS